MEQMPIWCPPTPPQQDSDVYIDQTMAFLYDMNVMTEVQLPPVYVKKENKRSRLEAGLVDSRRALKIHRKDESMYAPRSLFEKPSPALVKIRRDMKLQKFRGIIRAPVPIPSVKLAVSKPTSEPPCFHNWTIHEDLALLKVVESFQGLPLNLMVLTPGHTPNWDFVADYVNTVSITYRSPKQCRNRYETVLIPREEGKQNKSGRPMRTSQLYAQDNNVSFSQNLMKRYEALKLVANKRNSTTKTIVNNPSLKNPKHAAVLNECGIDLDHPVLPVEVAARRAERIAREKKAPEQQQLAAQRLLIKGTMNATQGTSGVQANSGTPIAGSTVQVVTSPLNQVTLVQTTTAVTTVVTTVITTPSTPPSSIKAQRIVASPIQTATVSVSGLCPAQLQAVSGKTISPAQLNMIRQANFKQQLTTMRLQTAGIAGAQIVKTTTVSIGGQSTLQLQFTQAQPRAQVNYIKPGTVTIGTKQGITRTVTESEMNQFIKQRHLQQQQQKALAAAVAAGGAPTTIQSLSPQSFVQTIQQAGSSGTQVATLVKAVSSSGVTQTVTIPVTGVTLGQVKALTPGTTIKTTNPQQIRHIQFQQQLLAQKKHNQKIAGIAQMGKGAVATQLIVGSKPFQTPISVQQFIKSPLTVQQGSIQSVVLKSSPRVIPMNAAQGNKPTIQVVAATSQGITTTIRPQNTSSLTGTLTSIKVPGNVGPSTHLLSQVSAAFQSQNVVRQSSPIRIQTGAASTATPIVAVSVQSATSAQANASPQSSADKAEQQCC
ncbi:hypothetical protein Trydic_g17870 [Trypoxylus dichotomus]